MPVIWPIQYPANKLDRLIHDGIIPPPLFDWDLARKRNLVANGRPPITFTRGSAGTYFDAYGVMQTASTNEPCFDHDPVTGVSLGLLIEEQHENECVEPRDLTDGAYTKTNTTAAKDAIGLTGDANSASTLTATANDGTCLQTVTKASAANTYSAWIRRKTGTGTIEITDNGGSNWTDVTSSINSTTYTRPTALTRTQANPNFGIRLGTSGDEIEVDVNQLEAGVFPSSPILTASVRSADVATIALADVSGFLATEGTIYWEGDSAGLEAVAAYAVNINDGTNDNQIAIALGDGGATKFRIRSGAADQAFYVVGGGDGGDANTVFKVAGVYATNDSAATRDGAAVEVDTSVDLSGLSGLSQINLGSFGINPPNLNGHIARLDYWNQRLGNAQFQVLTA